MNSGRINSTDYLLTNNSVLHARIGVHRIPACISNYSEVCVSNDVFVYFLFAGTLPLTVCTTLTPTPLSWSLLVVDPMESHRQWLSAARRGGAISQPTCSMMKD